MADTIHFRGTRQELKQLLADLVKGIGQRGAATDPKVAALAKGIRIRLGLVTLTLIQEAFAQKAAGQAGSDGIQWAKLKPQTIAQRDPQPMPTGGRGLLSVAQDKKWRMIFATRKNWLRANFGMSEQAASARAAQIAWATLKNDGAKTKLQVLGSRNVPIGRDSNSLYESLSPGTPNPEEHPLLSEPPDVQDRILRDDAAGLTVGSAVKHAGFFHAKRPMWPDPFPDVWLQKLARVGEDSIEEAIGILVRGRT